MQTLVSESTAGSAEHHTDESSHWSILSDPSKQNYAASWLTLQCSLIEGAVRGVLVLGEPDIGPFIPAVFWPPGTGATELLAEVAERSVQERQSVLVQGSPGYALSEPITLDGHLHGIVAIECASISVNPSDVALALRWGIAGVRSQLLTGLLADAQAARERLMTLLNLIGTALTETGFADAAHAVATELSMQLECDRISIGFRRDGFCRVEALSHSAQFGERMNLIRAIGQAMDEALDQNQVINLPAAKNEILVVRDHVALARQHGNDTILTIPFLVDGRVPGAFTFERTGARPFEADTIELCQGAVTLCSRVLELRYRAEQNVWVRARQGLLAQYAMLRESGHYGRKLVLGGIAFVILFFLVVHGEFRVPATATVEGAVRRQLIAPFDGYLESTEHRAGDLVQAGNVLAHLDERDLRLEYMRWAGQAEQFDKQYEQAVAEHDRAQSAIAQAQSKQAQAQMALLADQVQRATIVAPFDGIVVSGDLSQMLGSSVKRGQVIFEVSPLHDYRVILEVDEGEIDGVKPGQRGELVLASLPGTRMPMHVERVTPVVISKEGRSFFRVEAKLDSPSAGVRPGMEGLGKIELGQRSLFWIWTHTLFDWLRMFAWTWL